MLTSVKENEMQEVAGVTLYQSGIDAETNKQYKKAVKKVHGAAQKIVSGSVFYKFNGRL
jgi:hypothetical protein